jgi:hypothetical protein
VGGRRDLPRMAPPGDPDMTPRVLAPRRRPQVRPGRRFAGQCRSPATAVHPWRRPRRQHPSISSSHPPTPVFPQGSLAGLSNRAATCRAGRDCGRPGAGAIAASTSTVSPGKQGRTPLPRAASPGRCCSTQLRSQE